MNTKRPDPRPAGMKSAVHDAVDKPIYIHPERFRKYTEQMSLTQIGRLMDRIAEAHLNGEHLDFPFICLSDPEGE